MQKDARQQHVIQKQFGEDMQAINPVTKSN